REKRSMAARRRAEMMEETRVKLIAAAREAFARHGYAGASRDGLTAAEGVSAAPSIIVLTTRRG
ncbi:MAG: hypothetical protein WBA25_08700, partial [Jannaschia sp.]